MFLVLRGFAILDVREKDKDPKWDKYPIWNLFILRGYSFISRISHAQNYSAMALVKLKNPNPEAKSKDLSSQ